MTRDPNRLGPVERAIHDRDPEALLAYLYSRCEYDPTTGCYIWQGARREVGYGFVGRGRTLHATHRLAVWARMGMPGDIRDMGQVGHECLSKACLHHCRPVLAHSNIVESRVRAEYNALIKTLADELRRLDPQNDKLWVVDVIGTAELPLLPTSRKTYSDRELLRRQEKRAKYQADLDARARWRFDQVLDVRNRMANGQRMADALREVGISRRVMQDWEDRLHEWRERREIETGRDSRPGLAA